MKNREVFKKHQAQTFPHPSAIEITSANGNYLIDSNGFKYLDFVACLVIATNFWIILRMRTHLLLNLFLAILQIHI